MRQALFPSPIYGQQKGSLVNSGDPSKVPQLAFPSDFHLSALSAYTLRPLTEVDLSQKGGIETVCDIAFHGPMAHDKPEVLQPNLSHGRSAKDCLHSPLNDRNMAKR